MTHNYPTEPITLPSALACGSKNGQLGPAALADIGHGGKLEKTCAARAWNALFVAGKADGHDLTWTPGGTYRTIDAQATVFYQRMTTDPRLGVSPPVTRFYLGQTWYLKPGDAMVATPGTSNHGLGLAVDMASGLTPAQAINIAANDDDDPTTPTILQWLRAPFNGMPRALAFGWSWETDAEPWHLRYFAGDAIPQAVLDIENFFAGLKP